MSMDRPLEVISINEEGTFFELNEDNLKIMIERLEEINAKRCVVISVVGAFRSGKSFLLDLMLRYLYHSNNSKEEDDEKNNDNDLPNWFTAGGEKILEGNVGVDEDHRKPGFLWRGGKERMTTGIWMYGRPFPKIDPVSGEKVGVILMDTQGMFDLKTSRELTAAIFGLSTLISSYQIYNVVKQIQEDKLEQLDYFTQFSIVALKEFEKSQERTRESKLKHFGGIEGKDAVENIFPFQRVEFLVRDWQNFEDDDNIDQCLTEMEDVLDNAMTEHTPDRGTRDQIKKAFEKISCFLLPHPGLAMTKANYDGTIKKLEKNFVLLLDRYLNRIFSENISTKKVQGRETTPKQLGRYIRAYAHVFKDGKMPQAMTLVEAIASTNNLCARDDAISMYKSEMNKFCGGRDYKKPDELKETGNVAEEQAFAHFDSTATFGDEDGIKSMRNSLKESIDEIFEVFRKQNERKLQAGLEKYVIPLIAAALAFIVDFITDWTCDSWSRVCQDVSRYSAFFYYVVFLVLFLEFYRMYREQGSLRVGMGAMALGEASLEQVEEWNQSIKRNFSTESLNALTRSWSSQSIKKSKED